MKGILLMKNDLFIKYKSNLIYLALFILIFASEVFIALFVHDRFFRPYFGDVLVVILIYCFIRIFIPKKVAYLSLFVLLFAVLVEVLQYFDYVKLLGLENNRFFSIIMGRSFSFADIICYTCGFLPIFAADIIRAKKAKK